MRGTVAPLGAAGAKRAPRSLDDLKAASCPGSNEQIAKKKHKSLAGVPREGAWARGRGHASTGMQKMSTEMLRRGCGLRVRIAVK